LLHRTAGASTLLALLALSISASAQSVPPPLTSDEAAAIAGKPAPAAPAALELAGEAAEPKATPAAPKPEPANPTVPPAKNALEQARNGVVILQRGGKPIGLGMVLAGDGRVLTALSVLGHGNNVDARFADGTVSSVRVERTDRAWDLALVVPQNVRWTSSLRASRGAVTKDAKLSAFTSRGNNKLAPTPVVVKGERTLVGGDNRLLGDALELTTRIKPTELGTPIVDDSGDVVAVVARACAAPSDKSCTLAPYAAPVRAIKSFLRTASGGAPPPQTPWLGVRGMADVAGPVKGVRCVAVQPQSPAAAAGLRAGPDPSTADMIVAVDGNPVTTSQALARAIRRHAVGDSVQLLVFGNGRYRPVTLTLRTRDGGQGVREPAFQPRKPPKVRRPPRLRPPEPRPRGY